MKYARLTNSIVVDRVGNNPFLLFDEQYAKGFIECPDFVDVGYSFDGESWNNYSEDVTPRTISMRQARLELLSRELLDVVNAQISTMSQSAQIEWEYATEVHRNNPLVAQLQTSLNMTDSDMDLFFYEAIQL
jgi:hypothetical protein